MIPSQRVSYSASIDREPLKPPKGIRMIVWPIVNVEVWDIGRPMPRFEDLRLVRGAGRADAGPPPCAIANATTR